MKNLHLYEGLAILMDLITARETEKVRNPLKSGVQMRSEKNSVVEKPVKIRYGIY